MELYTGLFVLLGVVAWLIIGFNFAIRIHWAFCNPYSGKRSNWKSNAAFVMNTLFWVWILFYIPYAILAPSERR